MTYAKPAVGYKYEILIAPCIAVYIEDTTVQTITIIQTQWYSTERIDT